MEVSFDSSEEEECYLNIVIKDVCSVLDMEQGAGVVANPLFTYSDSEEIGEVEMTVEPVGHEKKLYTSNDKIVKEQDYDSEDEKIGINVSVHDYVYVKDSPENENPKLNSKVAVPSPGNVKSDEGSRSNSFSLDVAPNPGLHDDHQHGQVVDDGHLVQVVIDDGFVPVGSLVWAKMRGYPSWPAIVVPDPVTGRSREMRGMGRKEAEWSHVLFLEYSNEVAWLHQDQLQVFTNKAISRKKGRSKALIRAVEFANSLSSMKCMDRIRSFTEYQQNETEEEEMTSTEGVEVGLVWAKLSMNPVVRLERVSKLKLTPVVILERIESEKNSDEYVVSEDNTNNTKEDRAFTKLKPYPRPDTTSWCEGQLVWARVQGYPFWPAIIVREQSSDNFSSLAKSGLMRLHVMFLAYLKQHAWLLETAVVPFLCPDQFKTILKSVDKKFQRDFIPTKRLTPKYIAAVNVAMELLHTEPYDRVEYLHTI